MKLNAIPASSILLEVSAYGRLESNMDLPDVPSAAVQLERSADNENSASLRETLVSLYDLLWIPIGSLWRTQERVGVSTESVARRFIIDFTQAKYISAYEIDELNGTKLNYLIPPYVHSIGK